MNAAERDELIRLMVPIADERQKLGTGAWTALERVLDILDATTPTTCESSAEAHARELAARVVPGETPAPEPEKPAKPRAKR